MVRSSSDCSSLAGLSVETITGDLTDAPSLRRAVEGMDWVFHVAADYRLWVPDPERMHAVNVEGTVKLLRAAGEAGVSKVVHTSSVATVRASGDVPGTEADYLTPAESRSTYQRTKVLAEQAVRELIAEGLPITIVNPATPVGTGDRRPTPTGRLIVDYLTGKLPAYLDTTLNWISVEDVAIGHWLAATKGTVGERYILGNRNLSMSELFAILEEVSGRPAPKMRVPYAVAYMAAVVGNAYGKMTGREPQASLDGVRMAGTSMRYDSTKAVRELDLPQTPIHGAVSDAVTWYRTHGYTNS